MEKINLVNFIFGMIFAGVKFEINNENLDVYFPQNISNQREEEFYNFISANKEFIKSKIKYLSNSKLIHINDDIDEYELSLSQKSLWFAEQYETKSSPLNISIIFKLLDEIYLSDIKNSILKILNRHIPLSSIIEYKDDGRIFAKKIHVNNIDIEKKIVKESDIAQVIEKDILYKFDLSKEIPVKFFFYKQNNVNYLAIIFHHIAFDGWSVDVFFTELKQDFYEKSLPDLKANYIDYLLWQDNYLKSADSIASFSYWSNKLKDYLLLDFYRDKKNSDINNFAGVDENFLIEETDAVIMKSIAAEMGVSLYSLILSCYVLCLSAFTKQNDIILGTPLSNREDILTENLIGFFVNLMPVRVRIDLSNNFEDLARDVSYQIIEMQENQDIPLEKILDKLNIKPKNGKHPIFSAIFGLQSFGNVRGENRGLALDGFYDKILVPCSFDNIYKIAKFDLSLFIDDSSSALKCYLNYSTGVFEKDTISSFINCFRNIISQIIKNINIKISEIALISDESYELYSRIINNNGSYFEFESFSKIFFRTCELYKKKNAIISNEEILSYAKIDQIVQINSHLIASSTNEVYCGVLIKRSAKSIIAALSILVSGKAFVTIDPSYPLERIEYIIDDLGLKIIFTEKEIDEKLKALLERKSIQNFYVKMNISESQVQVQNSPNVIDQNDAYVIYTSGSTGNPKGVIISQLALANYIFNLRENNLITPNDIVDCSSNMCFDFTITTSIAPILLGATISVYEDDLKDIENYTNYLKERGVNVLKLIPFYFENIIQKIKDSRVNKIILGGEKISQSLRDNIDIYLNGSEIKIYDEYGPTEATVGAFISEILPKKNNTIGHPYKNFKAYVLDEHLRFVPSKAIGELYLSGVGLAKAYVNNTFETNNRFLNNKFNQSNNQYSRMYKTGDLVRWREDGNIEYIGRIDSQVKVSGYRIEIGEIEYAIKSYGDVKDTAVVFYDNLLLAYIVEREFEISAIEIQKYLEMKLPNYLIPSEYFFIEEIPVTHNGKIDYKSLIESYKVKKKIIVPPATEREKVLHKIWCEVLNLKPENLGINDNFFILGGDSIKSILLVNKIKRELGLKLSVKDIFLYKTIELISRNIKEDQIEGNIISEQGILNGEFNLLPIQKWFFLNNFSNPNYFNQSILINVPKLDISRIKQAINLLTDYHDVFRLAFKDHKQIYLDKPNNQFHFVNLNKDKRTLAEILSDFHINLDINNGKVASFSYIEGFSDRRARIFIVMHHLIVDYFSMHIIVKDLENLYYDIDLPLKGTSYRQWVNNTLTKNISEEDKNYWRDILSDIKREIFSHYLSSVNTDFCFEIDQDKTLELLECANKFYNTKINHLILTAISISISNITGENIIHICNEQHGRENFDESIDISRTVGWFTVMHPCRLPISDDIQQNIINTKESLENIPDTRIFGIDLGDQISNYPQILFNYLGKIEGDLLQDFNNWFLSDEQTCRPYDIQNISIYQLELNCLILQNRLKVNINATLNDIFLQKFQREFVLAINKIIAHINSQKANLMTPSDIGRIIDMSYLKKIQDKFEVEDVFLANSLQEGMIFHNLGKVSNDNSYIVQEIWSNKVVINSEKYKNAWEIAQSKYPSLRLAFFWDKEIIQVVAKNVKIDFRFIELNSHQSYTNISEILKSDLEEEYNLSKPGLFRVYLVKMSEDEFITILSIHHIIIDGWSIHCLINSVFEIYEYLILNSKIRISYDEAYKEYQRKLQSNSKENDDFWKEEVAKIDRQRRTLEILVRKDTNYNINAVENQQKLIEGRLYESLIAYCRERNLTLNSLIHYAWHKTYSIFSYSSQSVVGAVISGRNADIEGIEDSVGLFINTASVIVDHTPSNNYDKDIEKFQNHLNELNQRFNYRLSDITDSNEKLFDSIFVFENYPLSSAIAKDNFKFEFICTNEKTNYPIAVICFERDKSIAINIQYKPNLYCKNLINNILENYIQIISDIVLNHKFNAVNGLVEIIENRATSLKTINELFEEVVLKFPDKIAIFGDKIAISYMDLHKRANQLANYIRKKYPKSKNIAILLDRSSDIVITILAILKSRGCYIPIDVKVPNARILELVESSDINLVITNDKYLNLILGTSVNYISLDKEYENISQENITNPLDAGVFPDSPAYIKYTSGSTGKPKGVQVSHISVVNLVKNNNYFIAKQDDTFAYHSNISFDAVTFELFGAILNGAKVLIIPDNKLIEYLEEYKIDIIFLTTALFRELLDNYCHLLTKIKNIFYGGEKIILNIQSDLLKNTKITHVYGPTECTTFSTFYHITLEDSNNKPIGKNILGAECYVLDLHLNKVPFGSVGELYISGIGLASGYYRDAAATSQKFIANPFCTDSFYTSRMYKTGDIVQLLDDGNISFITRIDSQVKIRGRRIELPEIEYAINKLGIVQNSAACVIEENDDKALKKIIAFVVPKSLTTEACSDNNKFLFSLRSNLQEGLPSYMIPDEFVLVSSIPLNKNSKVDFSKLITAYKSDKKLCNNIKKPKNQIESIVLEIVIECLGINGEETNISTDTNIYSIGFNSIGSIKLLSQLNNQFSSNLKLADIFKLSTIELIADRIQNNENSQIIVKLNSNENLPLIFMIHPGAAGCEVYSSLAKKLEGKFFAIGIDSYNLNSNNKKLLSLNKLSNYYLQQMTKFINSRDDEQIILFGWSLGGQIALEIAFLLESQRVKNINIIILDSLLYDDYLKEISGRFDLEKHRNIYINNLKNQGYEENYLKRISTLLKIESDISRENISGKLKSVKIIFLKAMKFQKLPSMTKEEMLFQEYVLGLKYNNIDNIVDNILQIKSIELDLDHSEIIKNESKIIAILEGIIK